MSFCLEGDFEPEDGVRTSGDLDDPQLLPCSIGEAHENLSYLRGATQYLVSICHLHVGRSVLSKSLSLPCSLAFPTSLTMSLIQPTV